MEDTCVKTHRISGLVLAVLCCMTLVIAAAGARMLPEKGPVGILSGVTRSPLFAPATKRGPMRADEKNCWIDVPFMLPSNEGTWSQNL
jgi:hypothetical protein